MKTIRLNGRLMNTPEAAHAYLRRRLDFPDYYGANLDALWDLLSTTSQTRQLQLINQKILLSSLGDYGIALLRVFRDAAAAAPHLILLGRGFTPVE